MKGFKKNNRKRSFGFLTTNNKKDEDVKIYADYGIKKLSRELQHIIKSRRIDSKEEIGQFLGGRSAKITRLDDDKLSVIQSTILFSSILKGNLDSKNIIQKLRKVGAANLVKQANKNRKHGYRIDTSKTTFNVICKEQKKGKKNKGGNKGTEDTGMFNH